MLQELKKSALLNVQRADLPYNAIFLKSPRTSKLIIPTVNYTNTNTQIQFMKVGVKVWKWAEGKRWFSLQMIFCVMMICNDIPIETMKPIMRPDSKRALIFSAIRADSGDCGLNLNMFQILLWNYISDHIWGEKVYLRRGLLVSDSRFWRPTLALLLFLLFLALLVFLDSVILALAFSRVSLVLPPSISSAETQAKGALTKFISQWWVTSMFAQEELINNIMTK